MLTTDHPNTVEAREHRRDAIRHAARCLYRDQEWLDPDGDLSAWEWLTRIPYMDRSHQRGVLRAWLRNARIEGSTPILGLRAEQRDRLIVQMSRFAKGLPA